MIIGQARKRELFKQIEKLREVIENKLVQVKGLTQHMRKNNGKLRDYVESQLIEIDRQAVNEFKKYQMVNYANWENSNWDELAVKSSDDVRFIRVGQLTHQLFSSEFVVPARTPFIGSNKTFIIRSSDPQKSLELLQSLVVRTALMFPHQTRYTLLDPAGAGIAFPMRRYLPLVTENTFDIRRD